MTKAELAEKIHATASLSKHESQTEATKAAPTRAAFFMHHIWRPNLIHLEILSSSML